MTNNTISRWASHAASWKKGIKRVWLNENPSRALGWALAAPVAHFTRFADIDLFAPFSESIYNREWDLLIILDACRVDLLHEVAEEYEFISSIETIYSLGADSTEWMEKNFTKKEYTTEVQNTCYITGNPHTEMLSSTDRFGYVDEVWRSAFDYEKGFMPPRPITERAVSTGRTQEWDRVIVHYMQPHFPSIPCLDLGSTMNPENVGSEWDSIWKRLSEGNAKKEEVWDAYKKNLHHILDEIEILLQNIDAKKAVISSDHGNAIGELGFYGHVRVPIRSIREVPWCQTVARDEETLNPEIKPPHNGDSFDLDQQLTALGYK